MCSCLEGNLPRNNTETAPMIAAMCGFDSRFDYAGMMEEMFELKQDEDGIWSNDKWYCLSCVRRLFRQRFRKWLFLWKQQSGWMALISVHLSDAVSDSDWRRPRRLLVGAQRHGALFFSHRLHLRYGYNCRTQIWKDYHATRLNVSY